MIVSYENLLSTVEREDINNSVVWYMDTTIMPDKEQRSTLS